MGDGVLDILVFCPIENTSRTHLLSPVTWKALVWKEALILEDFFDWCLRYVRVIVTEMKMSRTRTPLPVSGKGYEPARERGVENRLDRCSEFERRYMS